MKPNQTLTDDTGEKKKKKKKKKKSSGYVLARVPIPSSPRVRFPGLVAVGSNIYGIEESSYFAKTEEHSYDVWILDCRTHTWCEAPSSPLKLVTLSASFLDGKIHVAGSSYKDGDSFGSLKNTIEVFDTETQIWDTESIGPCSETECIFLNSTSTCIDGKFHVMKNREERVAYNSKESEWDLTGPQMDHYSICYYSYCVIENVMYSVTVSGVLRWYDSKVSTWRYLTGLEGLPNFPHGVGIRLADYGGKLVVLWEGDLFDSRYDGGYKKIWCAEIVLEKRQGGEISGKVEWFDHVLTVSGSCKLVKALAVTV